MNTGLQPGVRGPDVSENRF